MKRFSIWLEQSLRRDQQEKVQKLYDMVVQQLLGSASGETHVSLSDIKDNPNSNAPPQQGARVVLKKLNNAQVFQKLAATGIPELATRAQDTQRWLNQIANDQQVGPKETVGALLTHLFGNDATDVYGQHKWRAKPEVPVQQPQNNVPAPNPAEQQPPPNSQMPAANTPPEAPQPEMNPQQPLMSPSGPFPQKPPGGMAFV